MHIHIKEEMSIKDKARWITTTSTQKPSSSKAEQWVKLSDAQAEIEEVVKVLEQETLANDTVVSELEAKNKELEELVNYYKSLLTSDKEIKERFKTLKK